MLLALHLSEWAVTGSYRDADGGDSGKVRGALRLLFGMHARVVTGLVAVVVACTCVNMLSSAARLKRDIRPAKGPLGEDMRRWGGVCWDLTVIVGVPVAVRMAVRVTVAVLLLAVGVGALVLTLLIRQLFHLTQ